MTTELTSHNLRLFWPSVEHLFELDLTEASIEPPSQQTPPTMQSVHTSSVMHFLHDEQAAQQHNRLA